MKRIKMLMSCVVALALLSFFCAPMVQAQVLEDTTHEVKLSASAVLLNASFAFDRTGGKVAVPVVLRNPVAQPDPPLGGGGFDYEIKALSEGDPFCQEDPIGTLSTFEDDENTALGELNIVDLDIPEPGLNLFGRFFANVKPTPGRASFKSVAGWAEVVVAGAPGVDPDGMTKKFGVKAKEKTLEKLGLNCQLDPAP